MLVGRCVPLVRSLVSIPAGFRRMPLATFLLYTTIGSLIWNTTLIGAGYLLRERWDAVEPIMDWFQYVVLAAIALAIAWFVWTRFVRPRLVSHARPRRPSTVLTRARPRSSAAVHQHGRPLRAEDLEVDRVDDPLAVVHPAGRGECVPVEHAPPMMTPPEPEIVRPVRSDEDIAMDRTGHCVPSGGRDR